MQWINESIFEAARFRHVYLVQVKYTREREHNVAFPVFEVLLTHERLWRVQEQDVQVDLQDNRTCGDSIRQEVFGIWC